MSDQLWWGLKPPDEATHAWGARAIYQQHSRDPLDFLPDRQSWRGKTIPQKDFIVVLNELRRKVKSGEWHTGYIKSHRSLRRPNLFYAFRVDGGYVYCLIYVKPLEAQL